MSTRRAGFKNPAGRTALSPGPVLLLLLGAVFVLFPAAPGQAGWPERVRGLAGPGGVLVEDSSGRLLFGHNQDKNLIPASIAKIITATAALAELGPGYRFPTEFRLTPGGDLVIIGRGDPLLISEELAAIAHRLKEKGIDRVRDILLEASHFAPGLVLEGTARSLNPYDAYNGALCVNFNTINVLIRPPGRIDSAEPQTPLTPLARKMAAESGERGQVRLNLAKSPRLCLEYAGELFQAFLTRAGVEVTGAPKILTGPPPQSRAVYLHRSSQPLERVVAKMMEYSNNFIANQIFLALGAAKFGPPAGPDKSGRAVAEILGRLGLEGPRMREGSGLSRRTLASPALMVGVLRLFEPHKGLLKSYGSIRAKTGTLSDVQSLAGYLPQKKGGWARFALILNGREAQPGRREQILELIRTGLARSTKP